MIQEIRNVKGMLRRGSQSYQRLTEVNKQILDLHQMNNLTERNNGFQQGKTKRFRVFMSKNTKSQSNLYQNPEKSEKQTEGMNSQFNVKLQNQKQQMLNDLKENQIWTDLRKSSQNEKCQFNIIDMLKSQPNDKANVLSNLNRQLVKQNQV